MERMVIEREFWAGRRVFLTGHTGFKGAWMSLLLRMLGAESYGYALAPESGDSLFEVASVARDIRHCVGDVRDRDSLSTALEEARPEIVIHMAAQALVRRSYVEPVMTYATNVMGTVNILEAVRYVSSVKAAVVVTSDKCYESNGSFRAFREKDRLGGHDPYSSSKACAELILNTYRRSFLASRGCNAASARAGNMIGGGDWACDRLVPDAMRAFGAGAVLQVRNPRSIRPWQHVLDPLAAYLVLVQRLLTEGAAVAESWNFGPGAKSHVTVEEIVDGLAGLWGNDARWQSDEGEHLQEEAVLKLDCDKANARLGWNPVIGLDEALALSVEWYQAHRAGADMRYTTLSQIERVFIAGERAPDPQGIAFVADD